MRRPVRSGGVGGLELRVLGPLAAAGEPDAAARVFTEAGGLWRGAAMAEVADAPVARAQAAQLEELRLSVLEDRIECELVCGRHRGVLGELEVLTTLHPLRE